MFEELTKAKIEEAIEKHWCPFCEDKGRFFSIKTNAWQEFWWIEKNKERAVYTEDWGDMLDDQPEAQGVLCVCCGEDVPKEVWERWFKVKK